MDKSAGEWNLASAIAHSKKSQQQTAENDYRLTSSSEKLNRNS